MDSDKTYLLEQILELAARLNTLEKWRDQACHWRKERFASIDARLDALAIDWGHEVDQDQRSLFARIGALEQAMKQYAKVEDARLTAYQDLDDRLDVLEQKDWAGLNAHLHTMWHDLERRFDTLEVNKGGST